jgi:hypothetical protein
VKIFNPDCYQCEEALVAVIPSDFPFSLKIFILSWRDPGKLGNENGGCGVKAGIYILSLITVRFFGLQTPENWTKLV